MNSRAPIPRDKSNRSLQASSNLASTTQPGDLWLIGKHRLYCGDATKPASYEVLFEGSEPAQMVFINPPYNVLISGHVCGLGTVQHREFEMASGEMTKERFEAFLNSVFDNLASNSTDGSIHYVCMNWRHMSEVLAAGETAEDALKDLCVWAKTNGGMGSQLPVISLSSFELM